MDGIDPLTSAPFFRFFRKYETDRSNVENGTGRDRVFFHPFQLYSYFIRQFKTFSVQKEMDAHRTSFFFWSGSTGSKTSRWCLLASKPDEVGNYLRIHPLGLFLLEKMVAFNDGDFKIWDSGLEFPTLDVLLNPKGLDTDVLITSYELDGHCNLGLVPGCKKSPIPAVTTPHN